MNSLVALTCKTRFCKYLSLVKQVHFTKGFELGKYKEGSGPKGLFLGDPRWDKKLKCKSNNAKSTSGHKLSEPIHDQAATQSEKNNLV